MAPCCGEDIGIDNKKVVIILIVLVCCVVISIFMFIISLQNDFEELHTFYNGFEGRKLMIMQKRLVYKSSKQQLKRYSEKNNNGSKGHLGNGHINGGFIMDDTPTNTLLPGS